MTMKSGLTDSADFVIAATGVLHHPSFPDIKGLDSFQGAKFHSAQWDHSVPLDGQRIGVVGWSFGGWAALALPESDGRVGAVVALVPGGSSRPLPGIIPATLTFDWLRPAPTLLLAAADDQYTPLDGQRELFERTRAPKRLFVLEHADHGHFGDQIDEPGECSAEAAHAFTCGLALAHLDATLKGDAAAADFLDKTAVAALAARGVAARAGLDCGGEPQDRLVQ